jgi:integrase-like protein
LTRQACELLREWKNEQGQKCPFLFPSPRDSNKPIGTVKKVWRTTLKRAGVSYFPIYNLRHVFYTRLSWVAPDAVVQRAMRHSSPETKRVYQLGLVHQVREHMERANDKAYQGREALHLRDSASAEECAEKMEACKYMNKKEKVARPGGLELPTFWFVARRSIQLSYGRAAKHLTVNSLR